MHTTELVKSLSVTNLINKRNAIVERITGALDLLGEAEQIAKASGFEFPWICEDKRYTRRGGAAALTGDYARRADAEAALIHTVDASAWNHLLQESGLRTFMDASARSSWAKQITEGNIPPNSQPKTSPQHLSSFMALG